MKKKCFFLILIYFFYKIDLAAQIIISSNSFINKTIPTTLITDAGKDFEAEFEFSSDIIIMSINILPQNLDNVIYNSWQINVNKIDLDWNKDIELYIRRTGEGRSEYNDKIQNGEYYQKIEANHTYFFEGQGWVNLIPIQLKLSGLSVTIPAKSYSTEIIFTLIDN